jgi:hypothetical protein
VIVGFVDIGRIVDKLPKKESKAVSLKKDTV